MQIGDHVRDIVTGFEGTTMAKLTALYEATQFRVQPNTLKSDDGSIHPSVWLEEGRLEVVIDPRGRMVGFVRIGVE